MIRGKGWFVNNLKLWKSVQDFVDWVKATEAQWVALDVAKGLRLIDQALTADAANLLSHEGIGVAGWHYIYGASPEDEARLAYDCIQAFHLEMYIANAEKEFKFAGMSGRATTFVSTIRKLYSGPMALSSYRFPKYHQEFPWTIFLDACTHGMPQVYWELSHNPAYQLNESNRQWLAIKDVPILPTGSAYSTSKWKPTRDEISEFLGTARSMSMPASSLWFADECASPRWWDFLGSSIADRVEWTRAFTTFQGYIIQPSVPPIEEGYPRLYRRAMREWPDMETL